MRRSFFQLFGLLAVAGLILSACNMPSAQTEPVATEAVKVVELAATQTLTVEVISSDTPAVTATETLTPEPSVTATLEPPRAEVIRETNCRTGPGGMYQLVAKYPVGQKLEVVAKDLGNTYWFVKNPEKPEEQCYLMAQNVSVTGATVALPKFTPPPSPTAAPYFKVSFKKFDVCGGDSFATFVVENVGSIPFRSVYIKVINQQTGKAAEQSFNAFDLRVGCVLAKNVAPLDPGETASVSSSTFKWKGHGEKLRAVIMICTEKDLKGTCVTQSVDIKG